MMNKFSNFSVSRSLIILIVVFGGLQSVFAQASNKDENHSVPCPSPPYVTDKFGAVNDEVEMARLDQFANQIRADKNVVAYIVYYGGKINKYGEFQERVKRINFYLSKVMKLDMERIKVVHGGFREKFEFELWLSYTKGSFPPLSPTIEPEKVKYIGKMKPLSYCCL